MPAVSTVTENLGLQRTALQPPDEITRGLFGRGRDVVRAHPLETDALLAAVLLALSMLWLEGSRFAGLRGTVFQVALVAPLAFRRSWPSAVFLLVSAIAFGQWLVGPPLIGDGALLVALYTIAAHQSRIRALLASALLEAGAVMAAVHWHQPAGTVPRSLLFLTATVVAAFTAGLTAASGSRYLAWMDERARRLAVERDQQAVIAAAAERTRIARDLHDIVSHSLSVVITLADAAVVVSPSHPGREAMAEVAEAGRQALSDMRAMLGVLRTEISPDPATEDPELETPQPGLSQLDALAERVRATGLAVDLTVEGVPFQLGASAELTAYRIVQEALTNTIRHARARQARVMISYDAPRITIQVADDGVGKAASRDRVGHGIGGMRERAALHGGTLSAGPAAHGGWLVRATLIRA
jgi:signal transduction histidine kinase